MNELIYKPAFSLRRLTKDLEGYANTYDYNAEDNTISFQYENKNITMQIDNFPFKPPQMSINDKPLIYYSSTFPRRLWDRYMLLYPDKCPCCKSILCENNWTPCFRLGNILTEYNTFTEKLKMISRILVFEHSFLPDDMIREIVSFLL